MATRKRRPAARQQTKLGVQYTRFSTLQQGSTAQQKSTNEDTALLDGVSIVKHFQDEGLSRTIHDRPGLLEMFDYLGEHPEIDHIVVNELERLTCGLSQRQDVARLCRRHGITILTEDIGSIDPRNDQKMNEADERAVKSHAEVIKVARRTRRALRAKVKDEGTVVIRPPYGIRNKPVIGPDGQELPPGTVLLNERGKQVRTGTIEPHPGEAPWLVKIFQWADEGAALAEICRRLMAAKVPTKTGRERWTQRPLPGFSTTPSTRAS